MLGLSWKGNGRNLKQNKLEDVPWARTLFQWVPTFLSFLPSSSSFTKQCKRESFSMCFSLYTIFQHNYVSNGNPKTLPFYRTINTQELCALFLTSFGAFCSDSLQNETLGLVKI
jgi:hypothetical protein